MLINAAGCMAIMPMACIIMRTEFAGATTIIAVHGATDIASAGNQCEGLKKSHSGEISGVRLTLKNLFSVSVN
jgi:hypothetical protein